MKKPDFILKHLTVNIFSATPKYLQLANAFLKAIREGKLKRDDIVPSINEMSYEFDISRDTAEKVYRHLKKLGVLGSVPGKGYFIKKTELDQHYKIFLLFNKLSPHKKIVYDTLVDSLGNKAAIDFYIYNNDYAFFKQLLENRQDDYTHYVIIPHFLDTEEDPAILLNSLPKEKLILLGKLVPGVTGSYGAVYEHFEKDIYGALEKAQKQLAKYDTIKLIFPANTYYPKEILKGFKRFCSQYEFNYKIVHDISNEPIKEGNIFINLMDDDLVTLIEKILSTKLKVGKHVGVISYNETPMKKIILNGITTISTDFEMMGKKTAQLILNGSQEQVAVPFSLTLRASL